MALYVPSAAISQIAGSVGNLVFSQASSGATIRLSVGQIANDSADAAIIKGNIATLSKAWAGLLATQRSAWTAFGTTWPGLNKLGQSFKLPGIVAYIRSNAALKAAKVTPLLSDPPGTFSCGTPNTITPTWSSPLQTLTVGAAFAPAPDEVPIIWATKQQSAGKNPKHPAFVIIQVFPVGTAGPYDITAAYLLKEAIWQVGLGIILKAQYTHSTDGKQGLPASAPVIIT